MKKIISIYINYSLASLGIFIFPTIQCTQTIQVVQFFICFLGVFFIILLQEFVLFFSVLK